MHTHSQSHTVSNNNGSLSDLNEHEVLLAASVAAAAATEAFNEVGQVAGGSEGAGLLKSVTAKTNIVADIIVGQVDCLQFCMSKAKSFMPNIIMNDK